jgi:hypothetical protein
MADINVNGRIKIKTFQIQFLEKFPYLVPTLRTPDGKGIDNELTIAGARGIVRDKFLEDKKYVPASESDLSINGNLTVAGFEKRFKESFGVACEICYSKGGRLTKTNESQDEQTLTSLNKNMMENGAEQIKL